MSHSVTITRTTTSTTNTSYIVLNTGYLKSFPGILKLFELIIGAAVVGILAYNYEDYRRNFNHQQDLFHFLMATTFMIGTFCLLLACLTSLSTGGIIAKTIYELIYHSVAAILLLASSIVLLLRLRDVKHDGYMAAGVLGLVNAVLYFISAFLAHRSYRGI
ncbi:uncharacterized protein Dana_GF19145 [Drosophila ananassae]|uniref:MARVEL domain-containing protein n=1 Tax=Drosophila ananassae TaxID=7217 RepID=B3MZD4_DROAN|nr:uncharacterized protein LOC6501907 [Drosophila ananassae]XP_032308106.1 uncharacterized protein LOC6501907 [Drosophila ananassae]EDV33735.1 uncharacterized protein Dana_GF19145 [Drosophila ananassae]